MAEPLDLDARRTCSVADCNGVHKARGWCRQHYMQWHWKAGPRPKRQLKDHFWSNVDGSGDCWAWLGPTSSGGYGRYRPLAADGRKVPAHRFAYEQLVGPVPLGLELDHLCRNRTCVNPDHLEAVSHAVNLRRGLGPTAQNARKTRCIHGHPFTPENTWVSSGGARKCRECRRISGRRNWPTRRLRRAA